MSDQKNWPTIERDPKKVSGACVFCGTPIPEASLFENLSDGASVDRFLDWFPGAERWQVESVLDHGTPDLKVQWYD